jgi:hypothetical protein
MNPTDSFVRPAPLPLNDTTKKYQKQAVDTVQAKAAASADPVMASSASLIASVQKEDAVQASADVIKLSAESIAKASVLASPIANNLSASASVITSVNKAVQGDEFSAASAAATAIEKASPKLASSGIGAIANVAVVATSNGKAGSQTAAVKESAQRVMDEAATPKQRLKATFDLTAAAQGLANFYRTIGNAAWKLTEFAITRAGKVTTLAPTALRAQKGVNMLAASRLGQATGFLNKWLPFLNVAGVALSAKTALDVKNDAQASKTTKALAFGSVAAAVGSLVAGFTLKGLPFFGVIAAGVATDIALANARSSDALGADTDARARYWATHPLEAVGSAARWTGTAIPAFVNVIKAKLTAGWARVAGRP